MLSINCIRCTFGPGSIASRGLLFGAEAASRNPRLEWDALSGTALKRKLHPGIDAQNGMHFPVEPLAESVSRNSAPEWDALSGWSFKRKLRPGISLQSGMPFPAEPSGGKSIPELTLEVGHGGPDWPSAENVSQFERLFRDAVSAESFIRKVCPVLSLDYGMRFPLGMPYGKRIPF